MPQSPTKNRRQQQQNLYNLVPDQQVPFELQPMQIGNQISTLNFQSQQQQQNQQNRPRRLRMQDLIQQQQQQFEQQQLEIAEIEYSNEYISAILQTIQESTNYNNIPQTITKQQANRILNENVYDVITMEDKNIKTFLEEDSENFVLYYRNNFMLYNKTDLGLNIMNGIVLPCRTPNVPPALIPDDIEDINYTNPLFLLRQFGSQLGGVVSLYELGYILFTDNRIFKLRKTGRAYNSLVGYDIYYSLTNNLVVDVTGRNHCNDDGYIHNEYSITI